MAKGVKIAARYLNMMRPGRRYELIYMADKDAIMVVPCDGDTWFFPEGMNPRTTYHFASAIRFIDDTLHLHLWDTDEIIEKKGCISWTVLAAIINERNNGRWGTTIFEEQEARRNG